MSASEKASLIKSQVEVEDEEEEEAVDYEYEYAIPLSDEVYNETDDGSESFARMKPRQKAEALAAERLSVRLLAIDDDDEEAEDRILRESLALSAKVAPPQQQSNQQLQQGPSLRQSQFASSSGLYGLVYLDDSQAEPPEEKARRRVCTMVVIAVAGLVFVGAALFVGVHFVGPPNQPIGPYQLVERQEGMDFFDYYSFYEGPDSKGSNGYNMYVGLTRAKDLGIVNVTMETDVLDVYRAGKREEKKKEEEEKVEGSNRRILHGAGNASKKGEPFIYMGSKSTEAGPRDSIRLEGIRRFDRGLFIIDIRHMPAGCGVWPAFWLTDEANWPVNGEIDIVEGVNYQSVAKTAMHSTKGCSMNDIPLGTMNGGWDTAQGIPDAKTGIPDMTLRYARDCFVYNPHQWLNQGCVAVDTSNGTLGQPLNDKGGGVYALEWDPSHRRIRTWVFTPHVSLPDNLNDAIRTASHADEDRIMPDPDLWPIPYGYFAIGEGTDCPASHFRRMRLVFNLAFCGSVAGNRFQMDCPKQAENFDTCNAYVKSKPDELNEAYWKIRGVFVYQRQWERAYLH